MLVSSSPQRRAVPLILQPFLTPYRTCFVTSTSSCRITMGVVYMVEREGRTAVRHRDGDRGDGGVIIVMRGGI